MSYTLQGIGSISNTALGQEKATTLSTSLPNEPSTSAEIGKVPEFKEQDKPRLHEQFSKYIPNTDMLVEKERKLLQALLLQKTSKKELSTKSDSSSKIQESKPSEIPSHVQSGNRIGSLIQKMANRVQKGSDEVKLDLPVIGTDNPARNEVSKPASASQILFGEHASPKKKETEKDSVLKYHSVKSLLFDARPGNLTSSSKKDLRKSPLVVREIESAEDESSTSSGTSESTCSVETDSNIEEHEHAEGRIEHVDLSAKLKSLLSADIFNVIESEKGNNTEDDDLIEILAQPSDSSRDVDKDSKNKPVGPVKMTQKDENEFGTKAPLKKGGINYSLNIKKKLGKLASMFSTVSLHKKYGINPQTLSKWKAKYQDESIAGLELTEEELKELEEVNSIKKAMYGSNAQEYDIYVDNPEEDEVDSDTKKKKFGEENLNKDKLETRHVLKAEEKKGQGNQLVAIGNLEKTPLPARLSVGTPEKTNQGKVKVGTPLYITLDEDASDEMKQQLRKNLKTQKTVEHAWSNGAFLESSKSSFSSVFGTDKTEETQRIVPPVSKSKALSMPNDTSISTEKDNADTRTRENDQRRNTLSRMLDGKTAESDNVIWEKTVYLCPDEGIFKYRYEKRITGESPKSSNENQTFSVLDNLFRSSDRCETSTDVQEAVDKNSTMQDNVSSSSPLISDMLKATAKQKLNTSPELLKKTVDKSVFDTVDRDDEKYSDNFKWTVVKEARKSGFEKTAKWYNISMTDIMKWHDTFLHEKKSKPLNTQVQADTICESDSTVVDLTKDVNMELNKTEPILIPTPVKGRLGTLNANLSFERIQVKEGAITKPRFNSRSDSHIAAPQTPAVSVSPSSRTQRTRMGPNTIKYATPKVDPDQLQKFQADVQGDLGIMPKLMKKSNSRDGVEIASTWKQVQSVLKPEKPVEKRYTQEFKQKIIAECERKGQKIVSQENRIPYNEISRWRLEAKKNTLLPTHQKSAFTKTDSTRKVDSSLSAASTITTSSKKNLSEQSTSQSSKKEPPSSTEQESLKIKIRLSTLPQATPTVSKKKTSEQSNLLQTKDVPKTIAAHGSKRSSPGKTDVTSKACDNNMEQSKKKQPSSNSKISNVDRLEPVTLDEDIDLRMEVINFCFDHGVLKTQKKYNVTRQSIIDLMKEYDELSKLEVDNYNKSHGFHTFKTKLVSREKTSVEVTNRATQPVIVKNLNDYIVTREYMKTVVDYALKHGITAASRKYKRKTSTVRSWMNQFQREVKKKISVEQVAKEQELIANNVSIEEARKISSQEARKKKQLLEAEFRRHIVEFARQFGITAASRRFKKKAATVKSWMGHFMKSERDAKRQEVTEIRKKQGDDIDSVSSLKQIQSSSSPRRLSHVQDSTVQKSPSSSRQRTPPHSPISLWDQDFVIKPTSGKSPLKLTFSPRRKSSPVIVIGSSTEEDTVDDETNDIETDDEQEHAPGEYYEVAAWNLDNCGNKSESKGTNSSKTKESVLVKEAVDNVVDLLSDEDYTEKKSGSDHSSKILSPNDGERIPEKTLQADTSKTSSSSDDSQAVDVSDIFDVENANIVSEIDRLLESKSVKENEKDAGHFSEVKDSEEPVIIDDDGNKANTEEEVKMPYEETVMFKLLTDELDNFMKNDAVAVKYNVQKETDVSKSEEKSPPAKETSVDKPMKKFKKYADAEIMQNIEETYLFTGARVTRNAVGKELKMCDEIMEEKDEREIETEEKIDDNDSKLEVLSTDTTQTKEIEDNLHLDCKVSVSENVNHEKSSELPLSDTLPVSDNQKKGERSLFDFLSVKPDTPKEDTKEVVVSNSVASFEKKDELKSPFSLFGNIMKSFQMEQSIGVKSPSKNECKPDNSVANSTDLSKDSEGIEKAEELVKDRTERNLFDFICPEPEMSKTPTKLPSPEVQTSPRMQTRSLFKSGKAVSLSPQKLSPVKITPLKKPMFKFPKLALPVNFGNIAKLGMAKMKEEEKAKEGNENKTKDDEQNEISVKESAAKESDQVKFETKKESSGEAKDEIVMETFEELRQRLSKERAANKLEKERAKEISDTDAMEVDEIDGSRETSANTAPKTSVEIDSEMYENFTPQKIVLILDISKKHGVEFASTSFGLPVSVIVNWIIEKDRKQRKVALSVSLEEKLKSLKNIKDREITREAVKEKYNVDDAAIHKWDSEISWMIEDKNVCDILEKWKTVETVSNINFEECSKNLERRDSVVEKELVEDQAKLSEQSDEKDNEIKKSKEVKSTIANDEENHDVEKSEIKIAALPAKSVEGDSKGSDACLPQENIQDKKSDTDPSLIIEDERVEKKPLEIVDDHTGQSEINPISEHEDIIITKVENPEVVTVTESSASENAQDVTSANNDDERDIPEIISFVRTTKPRDFTIEQKAMIVLLTEKYGNSLVNRKFGINTGTMYNWRHGNKHVRQFLYEQGHSSVKKTDVSSDKSEVSVKDRFPNETRSFTASDYLPSRETRSSSDKKITEVLNDVERTEGMKKQTASEPQLPPKSKLQGKEAGKEKDLINHPKGYRIISPTKLPSILKDIDIKSVQAKDYTLEQRVAIVKLVHLYGVRTIHKQFHISTTSIWSWQNCKIINEMLNEEEGEKNESLGAQREINFDVDEEGPMTIDTVLDRVLIATDTSSHLNFDTNQRADIVCLIDHFGIDYFCEKVPQIPRGTLWNWRHNKQVVALAKNREEMIKRYSDRLNTYEANKIRENVVGEAVDKTDLTQKWLKDVQDNIHGKRRGDSEERSKRKMEESEMRRKSYSRKKPKLGPMCYKRSLSNDRIKRSLSPSTVCSETSVHSEDFEEIFSDDELNTPSVVSKKSGTSSQTAQSSKTSRSQPRTSKGNASGKTEIGQVSQSNGLVTEKMDTAGEPVHEIVKFECGQDERMMVCYKDLEPAEASSKHVKADNPSPTLKRPSPADASTLQPPVKKKTQGTKAAEPNELGGNWVPLDEYYYGTHEGDTSYTEEKGEYRFKCWYCSKMLYNNVRAMQHIQGHIDASKQQNIDLSDLTQCKHCYKQFDTPFEMQTHVEKKHDSSHYMLCLYCLRTFEVKFVNQGWGQTQTYYGHLLKHQTKSATKKLFYSPGGKADTGQNPKERGKYVHCTMCRFATSCSVAYANHMMGFHSGQMSSLNLNIPWERPMKEIMFCACGFSSKYGNKIANHLVYCGKWTSYSTRRSQSEISSGASGKIVSRFY
ncbi:uncharacterized protein LOC132731011 [Ruditapes philippinarum]|uniref:uncharacterized protein LOC132731011 n=1 Tax=Ruditapes philippinarum TaxID=129788 RepID=UPI00295B615D|nr:uncharacterized protein LOC132731011 [Ruditapes philippinarum]